MWTERLNQRTLTFIHGIKKIRVMFFGLVMGESENSEESERIGVGAFRDLLVDLPETEKINSST